MEPTRFVIACSMTMALAASVAAQPAASTAPPQWSEYLDAVRQADGIANAEERCLAYPDLPFNEWLPGAAAARCSLLREPSWSLVEIDGLLASKDGATELERRFASLLDAHYSEIGQREQIFVAYRVFDDSERAGAVAARWLQQAPRSAYANLAVATHHSATGWKARGTKLASQTSETRLERMGRQFAVAVPIHLEAVKIEPRLSPACVALASIGRQSSDELERVATAACLRVDPDSYYVIWEMIMASQPRWGGSPEQLRSAVAYAAARFDRNPILGALMGESAGYAPSVANRPGEVLDALAGASRMAPSGTLINHAGRGFRANGDRWSAVGYFSQALRFWPRNADFRDDRATQLRRLGELDWAMRDQTVAVEEEPDEALYLYKMGLIANDLHGEAAGRPWFERAMADSALRESAMVMYCQTFVLQRPMVEEAADCTQRMVGEFPQPGEAWRLRAFLLYKQGKPEAIAAIDKFLQHADLGDTTHQRMIPAMEEWKARLQAAYPGGS